MNSEPSVVTPAVWDRYYTLVVDLKKTKKNNDGFPSKYFPAEVGSGLSHLLKSSQVRLKMLHTNSSWSNQPSASATTECKKRAKLHSCNVVINSLQMGVFAKCLLLREKPFWLLYTNPFAVHRRPLRMCYLSSI